MRLNEQAEEISARIANLQAKVNMLRTMTERAADLLSKVNDKASMAKIGAASTAVEVEGLKEMVRKEPRHAPRVCRQRRNRSV